MVSISGYQGTPDQRHMSDGLHKMTPAPLLTTGGQCHPDICGRGVRNRDFKDTEPGPILMNYVGSILAVLTQTDSTVFVSRTFFRLLQRPENLRARGEGRAESLFL